MAKKDQFATLNTVGARRDACGYVIQPTCAACVFCARRFRVGGRIVGTLDARCRKHDFPVNLDRGICPDFNDNPRHRTC